MSTVPLEVAERVVDYLHDDTKTLQSCALVSYSWLAHSRYHLFHSIVVDLCPGPCQRLLYNLQSAHSLDRYIKRVVWSSFKKAANHLEQLANANAGSTVVQLVRWLCKGQDRIHCIEIDLAEGDILIVCWLTIYIPEFAVSVNNMNLWFNNEGDWKCGVLIRKSIGLLQALKRVTFSQRDSIVSQVVRLDSFASWLPIQTITDLCLRDVIFQDDAAFYGFVSQLANLFELEVDGVDVDRWDLVNVDMYRSPRLRRLTIGLEANGFAREEPLAWLMAQHSEPTLEFLRVTGDCSLFALLASVIFQRCGQSLRELTVDGEPAFELILAFTPT
jgi:hypothetical protein